MKDFKDRVAVVTGAASGIGQALARRFAAEGMRLVLADIEDDPLRAVERDLRASGAQVLALKTDVADPQQVESLADGAINRFGAVHVVCNNAGVWPPVLRMWESSVSDWQWVLGVNLWGVINGIRAFTPILLRQDTETHIVNTASVFAALAFPFVGPYLASKHAVLAISEVLSAELQSIGSRVKVSVLCPGEVQTRIMDAARNRPLAMRGGGSAHENTDLVQAMRGMIETGMPPDEVAGHVLSAIREDRFFIFTHAKYDDAVQARWDNLLTKRNPSAAVLS
jgi:NAD(P)-dependent dehydrogenase (short-subunit alcohol dehydrogenase family)